MGYCFLAVFIISTVVHLYASLKTDQKLRNITKPFILLSLLGYYCFTTSNINTWVALALLFSWIGDVLLIPKGIKWFTAGGISFLLGHFSFVLAYSQLFAIGDVPVFSVILIGLTYITAVVLIFSKLKNFLPHSLFPPMFLYLLVNGTMNSFALFRLIAVPCRASLMSAVGAVLFFISDSCLFFVRFNKNGKLKTHFSVMLTYSLAEFLIICGLF